MTCQEMQSLEVHSECRARRLFLKQGSLCYSVKAFETEPGALLIILEGNLQDAGSTRQESLV